MDLKTLFILGVVIGVLVVLLGISSNAPWYQIISNAPWDQIIPTLYFVGGVIIVCMALRYLAYRNAKE